jgi:exoribonuclease-2
MYHFLCYFKVMIKEKSLVLYKTRPALVTAAGEKIDISVFGGEKLKVREKDVELLHPGPCDTLDTNQAALTGNVREAWELLRETLEDGVTVSLKELAELAYGSFTAQNAWESYTLLQDGLFFAGTMQAVKIRSAVEVEAEEKKRNAKKQEGEEREAFLGQLKNHTLDITKPASRRFLQDVEALAFGKSEKSRTMKELGLSETPEDAHALLLDCGFWTLMTNPYPGRFGVSSVSASVIPVPPPPEERRDLTHLASFAIDSPWSNDPDDAVSVENNAGDTGKEGVSGSVVLYVHVADPASSITVDSPAEREARNRGATLYLPEGSSRMLADESLALFALGLKEGRPDPALTFKITLDEKGEIADAEIFPSLVKVTRLSYAEADRIMNGEDSINGLSGTHAGPAELLQKLCRLADRNLERRLDLGAINIDLPETHISVKDGDVSIEEIVNYRSACMVRECMLLAGEGAGLWAERHIGLAFPYVTQEAGDIPNEILSGLAGSYQLRRCMRPRNLSGKPGRHWGLGLDTYTQVTSPLRRYTDLLAHMQIRSFLRGESPEPQGRLSADELLARLATGEAGAQATVQAERASRVHWTAVYLSGKKDSVWEATALEKKGPRWVLMVKALALETQVSLKGEIKPNDTVKLALKSVNIPRCEAIFSQAE